MGDRTVTVVLGKFLMTSPPELGWSWLQGDAVCTRQSFFMAQKDGLVKVKKNLGFRFSYPTSHGE